MVLQMGSSWIIINVPRDVPCQLSHCWVYLAAPFPRNGPFMAKTCSSHGPSNGLFLNPNHCAQGYSMPNFTLLGVSSSPFLLEMAKTWHFYGQIPVLPIGSSWLLINVPSDAPCQISLCWLNPVAPFPRNSHNVALLWPKPCPYTVLTWSSTQFLPES